MRQSSLFARLTPRALLVPAAVALPVGGQNARQPLKRDLPAWFASE